MLFAGVHRTTRQRSDLAKRTRLHEGVYNKELAEELTIECLRYMYVSFFYYLLRLGPNSVMHLSGIPSICRATPLRACVILSSKRVVRPRKWSEGYFLHESLMKLFDLDLQRPIRKIRIF